MVLETSQEWHGMQGGIEDPGAPDDYISSGINRHDGCGQLSCPKSDSCSYLAYLIAMATIIYHVFYHWDIETQKTQ